MNLIFIAFAAWLVLRCYHPYPPSSQPHPLPSIAAIYIAICTAQGQMAVTGTHTSSRLFVPPSFTHFPPFSFSGCLSLSPITLPVLVFDLQTLVGIMTTNQGWRWVITMWPTHPSWPFYSPHMMHLPDSFWEPAELHYDCFMWSSHGAGYSRADAASNCTKKKQHIELLVTFMVCVI